MNNEICISIIVPVYNSQKYILSTLENLKKLEFKNQFEIILIDDGSSDRTLEIIDNFKLERLTVLKLQSNFGPSTARNLGLKHAKGEYIYFMDADDSIENNTLSLLFNESLNKKFDIIFSDKKRIEKNINQRENNFAFNENKSFDKDQIKNEMLDRLKNPLYLTGLMDLTGRLIKRSIIFDNKIKFREELRYMEDETFMWDLLSYVKSAFYVREQLYTYNINPNMNTGLSEGLLKGFPLKNFSIIKNQIKTSFTRIGLKNIEIEKLSDQAFIFFVISSLISFYRSIVLGKVNKLEATEKFSKYINEINNCHEISSSIKNYNISKDESFLIPYSIKLKINFLLKIAVKLRVFNILKKRRKS